MFHKYPLTQNVTLENAYSKRACVSCPGQFRARAGNESTVSTTPLGVRHESKAVLARQKHWEHVSTQQKFIQFHTDFLIMNKTASQLAFRVFQVHKMSDFSISFTSFKSHVSCLESQACFGFFVCLVLFLVFCYDRLWFLWPTKLLQHS